MPRRPLNAPDATQLEDWRSTYDDRSQAGWTTYHCTLVTPLFGGGVTAGAVDREMPIRAASIRGQLRFWWRVACGPSDSSEAMFERECAIWGGISEHGPTASQVRIRVVAASITDQHLVASTAYTDPSIRYAFGPASINGNAQWLKPSYRFELLLFAPVEVSAEVNLALRWWASFGGIGARTRRGFGSVRIKDMDPVTDAMVTQQGGMLRFTNGGGADAEIEWKRAMAKLFEFRQGPGVGRRKKHPRPGRSYWPEPDQIRRFFPGRDGHGQHVPQHAAGNLFPRAAFGLPIRFEFPGSPRNGEPPTTELLPAGGEDRMASPLILRPHWDGRRWRGAALLLPKWEKALHTPLRLRDHDITPAPAHWPDSAAAAGIAAVTIEPMKRKGVPSANDPLSAFMHFFAEV